MCLMNMQATQATMPTKPYLATLLTTIWVQATFMRLVVSKTTTIAVKYNITACVVVTVTPAFLTWIQTTGLFNNKRAIFKRLKIWV